jgi:hypothetical protein
LHSSLEASLARAKGTVQSESSGVEEDVTSGTVSGQESRQLRVAEIAQLCRQACKESQREWDSGQDSIMCCKLRGDSTLLFLGAGNEYLQGALVRFAKHIGLTADSTQ